MNLRLPMLFSQVASPDDRFICNPYRAVLFARSCAARFRAVNGRGSSKEQRPGEALRQDSAVKRGDLALCVGCAMGKCIAKVVAASAPPLELGLIPGVDGDKRRRRWRPSKRMGRGAA